MWPLSGLPRLLSCLSPHSLPRRCMQSQAFKHQSGASHSHIYSFIPSTSPKLLTEHFHLDNPQVVSDCLCPKTNSSLFTPQPPPPPVTHLPSRSFQKVGRLSCHPPPPPLPPFNPIKVSSSCELGLQSLLPSPAPLTAAF